jgi:hypothetical protein
MSDDRATGATALAPGRRNQILGENPDRRYVIRPPGSSDSAAELVRYDSFHAYTDDSVEAVIRAQAEVPAREGAVFLVTASVLRVENYAPILRALDTLAALSPEIPIFLIAGENAFSADDVLRQAPHAAALSREGRARIVAVPALVDRMCVGLEEDRSGPHPAVLVRAEQYGSMKLELNPDTEALVELCRGSRVEFSRHVAVEKQIKSWLLNGTHSLIALSAFQAAAGDPELRLDTYLAQPAHAHFAAEVMTEMREGVAALLRQDPRYAAFRTDVDVEDYLDGAARSILQRFHETQDPITRILARFQAPTSEAVHTVESFSRRFADRVDGPMRAYEELHGTVPPAASHSIQDLLRLIASGMFVDARSR